MPRAAPCDAEGELMRPVLIPAILAAALAITPAQAAFNSAYTDLDFDQCLVLDADDFVSQWSCPGYRGYPLKVIQADLRFALQFGFNLDQEPKRQTLPPFNTLGPTLEWRLSNESGRWLPIATIARYDTASKANGTPDGEVLVVTQLKPGQTCHIAYIDARANPDADVLARAAADTAGRFDCASDTIATPGNFKAW
jgi:hypothetical protein